MKKSMMTFLLIIVANISFAQLQNPIIHDIEVIPDSPTVHETVKIRFKLFFHSTYYKIWTNWEQVGDTIKIITCYWSPGSLSAPTYTDSVIAGKLSAGNYYLLITAYESYDPDICQYIYSNSKLDSFSVYKPETNPVIHGIEVLPNSPDVHDNVNIRFKLSYNETRDKILTNWQLAGDTIKISTCYTATGNLPSPTYTDSVSVGKLSAGNYYIHVTAYESYDSNNCEHVYSNSKLDSFSVDLANSNDFKKKGIRINIFPNPANHLQKIEITTRKQEQLSVELFDLQGRLIKNIYHGKPSAGENIFSVDFSPLARGVYYYRIMLGEKHYFQKTIKH